MTKSANFFGQPQGIHYCSPAHGGWGVVRTALLLPGVHLLFVCPAACGRHGALAAIEQGIKPRVSYLCIDEVDIVTGNYEELVAEAASAIVERAANSLRALFIFVSCLDDLLATDYQATLDSLSKKHGIPVRLCRMNPIMLDTDTPPAVAVQRNMYSLLERDADDRGAVNLMGVFTPLLPGCELPEALASAGVDTVRSLPACETYEDVVCMGRARLNIVLRPEALYAAKDLRQRLSIEYCFVPVSYRLETIARQYGEMGRHLDILPSSLDASAGEAEAVVGKVKRLVGNRCIHLDAGAFCRPFDTARALVEYGFNVRGVYADKLPAYEKEAFDWLRKNAPEVDMAKTEHHAMVKTVGGKSDGISLGFNSGYITGSSGVVPLEYDEGMFGYHGVARLMAMLAEADGRDADIRKMIYQYGLVV